MKISMFLHLLSAMLWIGGMAFAHFALRPAAAATLAPPQRLPLMSAALGRFLKLVSVAIAVLLLTGLHMIFARGGFEAARAGVLAMFGGGVANALRGVEAKPVEVILVNPVASVRNEILADGGGVGAVEVERITPFVRVLVGEVRLRVPGEDAAVRTQMVVDDV